MSFYPPYDQQFAALGSEHKNALAKIPHLEEIEGWLLLIEAAELHMLASRITTHRPIVCEIGSWKGKSSYIFASALRENNGTLFAVDPFDATGDGASEKSYREAAIKMEMSLLENFMHTMEKYALTPQVQVLPKHSADARNEFKETSIDLLFIDGNHDYDAVKTDYELWSPLIPSGGILVLHDVGAKHVDGPRRVMDQFIAGSPHWKEVRMVGEMAVAIKR